MTPARNESGNIGRLADSMAAQRPAPVRWIVVDDASDDDTFELATELSAELPWMSVLRMPVSTGELTDGRRVGRDLLAFLRGIEELDGAGDIVVKVDADVAFEADFGSRLVREFADHPRLGIASGECRELEQDTWVRRTKAPGTLWGATRAYRRACLTTLEDLDNVPGWDGVDALRANLDGWETRTVSGLSFDHHRPRGARERGRFEAAAFLGDVAWYLGSPPSYVLARAIYRSREDPTSVAMVYGYARSALAGAPRYPDVRLRRLVRERQRLRTVLRSRPT